MNKEKSYFSQMSETLCFPKESHIEFMMEEGLEKLELVEAEVDKSCGYSWCRESEVLIEDADKPCGKHCKKYTPINGKSGKCEYKGYCYTPTTTKITIYREYHE